MLGTGYRLGIVLAGLALLWPGAALATPLGLSPGDVVSVIEWGAEKSNGDGGSFVAGLGNVSTVDGELTSVEVQGPTTNLVSDTDFTLSATLTSTSITPLGGTFFLVVAEFGNVPGDDIVVTDNTGVILTAEFTTPLQIGGVIDTNNLGTADTSQLQAADIQITGGDANLVAALGAVGTLVLTGQIDEFDPTLAVLAADNDPFNSNFTFSGSGIISPTNPAPFVPEPTTLVLLGGGLVGLGFAGRARRI